MHRKSVTKRSGVALFLCAGATLVGEHKENSIAKTLKILQTVGIPLQDLDFVVAAFCESVCIGAEKGIGNRCKPIVICFSAFNKCGYLAFHSLLDPIRKKLLLLVWIRLVKYGVKRFL